MKFFDRLKIAWKVVWSSKYIDELNDRYDTLQKEYINASSKFEEVINSFAKDQNRKLLITNYDNYKTSRIIKIPLISHTKFQSYCNEQVYSLYLAKRLYQTACDIKNNLNDIAYDFAKLMINEGIIQIEQSDSIPNNYGYKNFAVTLYYYK